MREKAIFIVFVAGLITSAGAHAGERLGLPQLLKKSDAVVEVSVYFPPKNKGEQLEPKVEPINVLWVSPTSKTRFSENGWDADIQWSGPCAPDRALLKRWIKRHPRFPEPVRRTWKKALKSRGYKTILFLKQRPHGRTLAPFCGTESLLSKSWSSHPQFASYMDQLNQLLTQNANPPEGVPSLPAKPAGKHPE